MAAVVENLREDHRNISRLLDALDHQIGVFSKVGDPDYDIIRGISEYFLDYPDACHHPKEDVIFTRIKERHVKEAETLVDLLAEHRTLHEQTARFHYTVSALLNDTDIARSTIVDATREFIEAERRHMQKEEAHFFSLAERVLTPADWSHIEGMLTKRRDPLLGERVEERFKNLRERLLSWEREYRAGEGRLDGETSN